MTNNQNEGWKGIGIFITLTKYNIRQRREKGKPLLFF